MFSCTCSSHIYLYLYQIESPVRDTEQPICEVKSARRYELRCTVLCYPSAIIVLSLLPG